MYCTPNVDPTFSKVFIGNLAYNTTSESLEKYFQTFGHVIEAKVIFDKTTGKSKGFGFVSFKHFPNHKSQYQINNFFISIFSFFC